MSRRGFSLAEMLIAMALASALLTVVVSTFVGASRLLAWMDTRSVVATQAVLGLERMAEDIRNSTFLSMTVVTTPTVTVLSMQIQDPSVALSSLIQPVFQAAPAYVLYYYTPSQSTLSRKTYGAGQPPTLPTPPAWGTTGRLAPADVLSVVGTLNGTEHVQASSVASMVLQPTSFPLPTPVSGFNVQLTIQASTKLLTGKNDTLCEQVQTLARPRN